MTAAKAFRISLAGAIYTLVFFTAVFFGGKRISPAISAVTVPDLVKQNSLSQNKRPTDILPGSFFPKRIEPEKRMKVGSAVAEKGATKTVDSRLGLAGMATVKTDSVHQPAADTSALPTLREVLFKKATLLLSGNKSPRYPRVARINGYEGIVMLALQVTESGKVESADLVRSSGFKCLDRSALEAVREWRFSPAEKFGRPVSSRVELPVIFKLNPASSED